MISIFRDISIYRESTFIRGFDTVFKFVVFVVFDTTYNNYRTIVFS